MIRKRADQDIITGLKAGGIVAEGQMRYLYRHLREPLLAYLQKQGAKPEEAKDVFQESLLCLYENVQGDQYRGQSSLRTYLISIARFIWLNQRKRADKLREIKDQLEPVVVDQSQISSYLERERDRQLAQFMNLLDEPCQAVLRYAYYEEWSAKQIAEAMDYKNEQIARNKKFKCLRKLRSLLENNADWLAYFKQLRHE